MITKATAAKIWNAYQEIDNAKRLMADIEEVNAKQAREQNPRDESGGRRGYEMGVPCSSGGHRIFQVRPDLGNMIILEHIKDKEKALVELEVLARQELGLNTEAVDAGKTSKELVELTREEQDHLDFWGFKTVDEYKEWHLKHFMNLCLAVAPEYAVHTVKFNIELCKKLGILEQIQAKIKARTERT